MQKYVINGKFLCERMQGIVRYATEITFELDKIIDDSLEVVLLVPSNLNCIPRLQNIKVVKYGKNVGIKWELFDLWKYLKSHKEYTCINFCNIAPIGCRPGITVIHDIMYKVFPENYKSLRNRMSRVWHCLQYSYVTHHEKLIITVSNFSKKTMEEHYPKVRGKVTVIPNSWEHILNYNEDQNCMEKFPFLKEKGFYFSLATLSKNKNGKWIIEIAKKNPGYCFAMGGKIYEEDLNNMPNNVKLLGFVTDNEACFLMKNCKAFLFPSLYEGFGIPPLEALALGAEVVSSNTTSMPEVLGNSVHYIDPNDYDVNLEELLTEAVEERKTVLNKYGWDKSAKLLLECMEKLGGNTSDIC